MGKFMQRTINSLARRNYFISSRQWHARFMCKWFYKIKSIVLHWPIWQQVKKKVSEMSRLIKIKGRKGWSWYAWRLAGINEKNSERKIRPTSKSLLIRRALWPTFSQRSYFRSKVLSSRLLMFASRAQ